MPLTHKGFLKITDMTKAEARDCERLAEIVERVGPNSWLMNSSVAIGKSIRPWCGSYTACCSPDLQESALPAAIGPRSPLIGRKKRPMAVLDRDRPHDHPQARLGAWQAPAQGIRRAFQAAATGSRIEAAFEYQ